jgi:large subunit ribosomal protein L30e
MTLQEIKKNLDNDNLIIGYDKTLKNLKLGKISKVYLSVNCPDEIKEDVKRYANINKTDVEILKKNNEDLGVLCKKPFSISVLSIVSKE